MNDGSSSHWLKDVASRADVAGTGNVQDTEDGVQLGHGDAGGVLES